MRATCAGAAALWDQVAADSSADPLLRDLASLLWAQHQIDSGDPSLLEARLKALAAPENRLACAGRGAACAAGPAPGEGGSGQDDTAASGAGHHGAEWRPRAGEWPAEPAGRVTGMARNTRLTRRTALLAPLALGGCGLWDDWFGTQQDAACRASASRSWAAAGPSRSMKACRRSCCRRRCATPPGHRPAAIRRISWATSRPASA